MICAIFAISRINGTHSHQENSTTSLLIAPYTSKVEPFQTLTTFTVQNVTMFQKETEVSSTQDAEEASGEGSVAFEFETLLECCKAFDDGIQDNCTCASTNELCKEWFCIDGTANSTVEPEKVERKIHPKQIVHLKIDVIIACISIAVGISGMIGNFLVIIFYLNRKQCVGHFKLLISILAFCDLFLSVVLVINNIPNTWTKKWQYGLVICKLLISIYDLGAFFNTGIITLIAVERYLAIVHALSRRQIDRRTSYGMLMFNFLLATAVVSPQWVVLKIQDNAFCSEQWPHNWQSLTYVYFILLTYFLLPCCVIGYSYITSIKSLYEVDQHTSHDNASMHSQRVQENRQVLRTLVSIMVIYVLFHLPTRVVWLTFNHVGDINKLSETTYLTLKYISLTLYPFNVIANPLVYCLLHPNFRQFALRGLRRIKCLRCILSNTSISTESQVTQLDTVV